jgi:hypothetical protein
VPERVAGPVVEELSRIHINRPALSRSVAYLGDWAKGVMERAEKEKAEKEKEQERGRTKQTELLQLRGMLSMRGAIGESHECGMTVIRRGLAGCTCAVRRPRRPIYLMRPNHDSP